MGRGVASGAPASESIRSLGPGVLAVDSSGNEYVAVRDGVLKTDASGTVKRVAGTQREWRYSGDGGPATGARLNPHGVTLDKAGNLYLADSGNNRIRRVDAATGVIATMAGNGVQGFSGDGGPAASAQLDGPTGVALDSAGNLYIADGTADGHMRIRRVAAGTGVITTIAGNGSQGYSGDGGPATNAQLSGLGGLATDARGNLYIADNYNNRIRKVSAATGVITTVAGSGIAGRSGDGGPAASAELNNPLDVLVDAAGNLYIADSFNFRVREVSAGTGNIATLAPDVFVYPDSQHGYPCALALDGSGNLYVADFGGSRIRKIQPRTASLSVNDADLAAGPVLSQQNGSFTINVTFGTGSSAPPAAAETAYSSIVSTYESLFSGTNITVNLTVDWGDTGLGESDTFLVDESYSSFRTAMLNNASANPGNTYNGIAAASLPSSDPIGGGTVEVRTANARALGFSANSSVDSALTFSNAANTFEYTGVPTSGLYDFMDVATHETDEGVCIGSALTGLANNATIPANDYEAEDYFRYSATRGVRDISTSASEVVYFSYDGSTDVAQFNQNNSDGDRNDWIYADSGCPAAPPGPYIQDAIGCPDEAVAIGQSGSPEVIVLSSLGYNSSASAGGTPQTITFSPLSNVTFGVAPFTIGATTTSGLTVTFTSTTTSVCTVSGTTLTIVAGGPCSITASQPGNATFAAASPVTRSFTVNPATQTITFNAPGSVNVGVAPFTIVASTSSGLPLTFISNTTSVCTLSGSTVTIQNIGTCSITASQPGDASYSAAASVSQSFMVNQGTQTITFASLSEVAFGVAPFTIVATASSGLPVTLTSSSMTVCVLSGTTVTIQNVGLCSITATQAGNTDFSAATPVSQNFNVYQATQTITFAALGNVAFGIAPFTIAATASSGLPVSFTSASTPVCTVTGAAVTIVATGACSIVASQAGNTGYAAATPVSQSFNVYQATQTITFAPLSNVAFGTVPFTVAATANSGLAVSFTSATMSVCTVAGATVTIVAPGVCSIVASQTGNPYYAAAAPVSQSFNVSRATQTITFPALSNVAFGAAPFTVAATASSGLAVSFTSTTMSVCTVAGATVTIVAPGACSIVAGQAGNTYYAAALSVTNGFTVFQPTQTTQTIAFGALSNMTLGAAPFTLTATATSGLTVLFASTTAAVCTVSGSTVTIVAAGICSIMASQPGNTNFSAAVPVTQSFTVTTPSLTAFSELGIFRAPPGGSGGFWLDLNQSTYSFDSSAQFWSFGSPGDQPVAGDWTGTGVISFGVFRQGVWYIDLNNNGVWDGVAGGDAIYNFGQPGDIAIPGDWNGTGVTKLGVFRCPIAPAAGNCTWYLDAGNKKTFDPATAEVYTYGQTGDRPVVNNWNGTGTADQIGVFRCPQAPAVGPCSWIVENVGDGVYRSSDPLYAYGQTGDLPLVGNWSTGPQRKRIGVFRQGTFFLETLGTNAYSPADIQAAFGQSGDLPVVGSWTTP